MTGKAEERSSSTPELVTATEGSTARTETRASDPIALVGTCPFCNHPVQCCETIASALLFYDDDAGDLVPHDCAWLKGIHKKAADFDLLNKMYSEMCETLHECVQKHRIGLGGEQIHKLVVAEIDRCRTLLPTPAEASAMLNASTYSKSSVSRFQKLRSLRDGA